jgi:serine/threonine protein kinase/WD40 repeat protein
MNRMDPVVPAPENEPTRAEAPDFPLLGQSSIVDIPDGLSATGEFHRPPPFTPEATLSVDGSEPRDGPPPIDSLRFAVPGYEILSELGRGGMGVVYLARQLGLNRPVALKMILSGEHAGSAERDRFRREAEAVAALQHPNIVQIYDIGEAQGRPYLAFEYISGGSLSAYLEGQPWPAKPAADLVEAVARAMQYAHERGIVHRDLKPANILLSGADLVAISTARQVDPLFRLPPEALRAPKITDFGLAKRVEPQSSWSGDSGRVAAPQTRTGAVVGTPSYLAPEQAAGKNRTVGPHTDVYALGAILYELLTGRPPFRGETPLDTVLQVMADDPVPPSKLRAKLPRDLETICLKCLQKDPRKRYHTARELADDLARFQRGEAIAARPVGRWERAVKWMNRHPAATVLGITSLIALVSLLTVSVYYNVELRLAADKTEAEAKAARDAEVRALAAKRKADEERIEAERQKTAAEQARLEADARRRESERGVYALQLFKAAALGERDPQRALRLLDDVRRCPQELRDFTWRYIRGQCLVTEQVIGVHQAATGVPPAARVVHSPDGSMVATVSGLDPMVRIYDVAERRLLWTLVGHQLAVHGVTFSPDGKLLATAGADNTVRIWELPSSRPKQAAQLAPKSTLTGHTNTVNAVAYSPDGKRLASAGADGVLRVWEIQAVAGKPAASLMLKEHTGTVWSVVWSAAGLFSGGSDGRVLQWRLGRGGNRADEIFKLKKQVLALAASPDGEFLAAAGDAEPDEDEPVIELFRPLSNRFAGTLRGHTGLAVYDLSFAPDGKRIASAGRDGTVRVWDVAALQERAVFRPEKEPRTGTLDASVRAIRGVSFEPRNGLSVVSGGQDGAVRLWSFAGQKEEAVELDVRAPLASAVMSADGQVLAVAERVARQIKLWRLGDPAREFNPKPTRTLVGLDQSPQALAVNADGTVVAAATSDGVYVWRGEDRPARIAKGGAVAVALRGDDLVFAADDGQLKWLDLRSGRPRHSTTQANGRTHLVAFSPDGRKLITAGGGGGSALQVWDADTGELLFGQILAHYRRITAATIRPGDTTGRWEMATADEGGLVKVWELSPKADGSAGLDVQTRPAPTGLNDPISTLAFTADGRTLASGGADRALRFRDPETGQERAALAGHTDVVLLVAFRADQVLLTVGREGFVRVWRAG